MSEKTYLIAFATKGDTYSAIFLKLFRRDVERMNFILAGARICEQFARTYDITDVLA